MKHLLLLHGALGAKEQLLPIAAAFEKEYTVHMLNFSGHGGEPLPAGELSVPLYAGDVLAYMEQHAITATVVFGYSMGGYVGMYLAKHHPAKITKLVTLAAKFHWDEPTAARELKMLDPAAIEQKVPAFAQQLARRHAPGDWKLIMQKTATMLANLGRNNTLQLTDYATVSIPVLVLLGDRDKMVTPEESIAVYKQLPNAQLGMLPGTAHPLEQVDTALLHFFISRFLQS